MHSWTFLPISDLCTKEYVNTIDYVKTCVKNDALKLELINVSLDDDDDDDDDDDNGDDSLIGCLVSVSYTHLTLPTICSV